MAEAKLADEVHQRIHGVLIPVAVGNSMATAPFFQWEINYSIFYPPERSCHKGQGRVKLRWSLQGAYPNVNSSALAAFKRLSGKVCLD